MGSMYHETYSKSLPAGAELFNRNGEQFLRLDMADKLAVCFRIECIFRRRCIARWTFG